MILIKRLYDRHGTLRGCYIAFKASIALLCRFFFKTRKSDLEIARRKKLSDDPARFRGTPHLTLKEDGSLRCISCRLCESYCPTNCIYIESEYSGESGDEGPPSTFQIEILRCVFCSLCVDACPVDALRMSSKHGKSGHAEQNWTLDEKFLTKV